MEGWLPYGFAIVGVQKAGTSTLSQWLDRHPQISRAPRKELQFFTREDVDWSDPPYEDYRCPVRKPGQVLAGDATPAYLWWPHALERMRAYDPGMRLVAVFRDPLERAFSQWSMLRARNPHAPDWPEVLRDAPARLPGEVPSEVPLQHFKQWSVVSRGYYDEQLERGLSSFPRDQWLLLEFRAVLADPEGTLARVTDFLGLERYGRVPPMRQALAAPDRVVGTAPTAEDVRGLAAAYAGRVERFAALSGVPTGDWPTTRIARDDLDPAELAARWSARVVPQGRA